MASGTLVNAVSVEVTSTAAKLSSSDSICLTPPDSVFSRIETAKRGFPGFDAQEDEQIPHTV